MPIYAYRCSECGHQGDHLQKMSDSPLTICPACQTEHYQKQLSAVSIALKASNTNTKPSSPVPHQCGPGCQH